MQLRLRSILSSRGATRFSLLSSSHRANAGAVLSRVHLAATHRATHRRKGPRKLLDALSDGGRLVSQPAEGSFQVADRRIFRWLAHGYGECRGMSYPNY